MATILDVVRGLSQAAANAYDGALDENGDPIKAGLKREDGDPILDKRVIDGFNVVFYGNRMCLGYHSEIKLKEVYGNGFEGDIDQTLEDVVSFLKKEYRKITGESVSLKADGEVDVRVESSSRVRSWVTAKKHYVIQGVEGVEEIKSPSEDRLDVSWRKFLELGGLGTRPKNDKRPKNTGDKK
jgi:hypothetical protein